MQTYHHIYHSVILLVVIRLCNQRCWHLDSNNCRTRCRQSQLTFVLSPLILYLRLLGMFQSNIPFFTLTWPAKQRPNQGREFTHRFHLYPMGGVFYVSIGRRDFDFRYHLGLHEAKIGLQNDLYRYWYFAIAVYFVYLLVIIFLYSICIYQKWVHTTCQIR